MTNTRAYIPVHALRKIDIDSIFSIALPLINNNEIHKRYDYHHNRRTMLYFLLSIYSTPNNERLMCLINEYNPEINWIYIEKNYNDLKNIIESYQRQYHAESFGNYWELNYAEKFRNYWELQEDSDILGPKQSCRYISKYRFNGFLPEELKIYWNYNEIRDLNKNNHFNPITDTDTHDNLLKSPVNTRENSGIIQFIQLNIENAVFQVPEGKQVIVLDFANERIPGGYFLENVQTQEEVILYNSDGYRALLDLKYKMMDGGYMLPEYGVAYMKRVRFFQNISEKERITDLIVTACYDLSGIDKGLYKPPSHENLEDLRSRTFEKFQAIIASAVANTEGNGKDTYLLLGPIGTAVFANDIQMIIDLFFKILNEPLLNSKRAIRYAFDQIWFVSIDKLDISIRI
ncbi:unnamed protein product [Rotaria sordida]|uniref:Microbial-type PARG catalytic domain-containing protein n=2 Tax=Rotaria sordida TaxID=392033 RepID=A0A814X0P3_9BILA|nr:unnamed protein product [Rotaria sordida]CAF4051784.1 unnamed protein product [Rotaria sordida]